MLSINFDIKILQGCQAGKMAQQWGWNRGLRPAELLEMLELEESLRCGIKNRDRPVVYGYIRIFELWRDLTKT